MNIQKALKTFTNKLKQKNISSSTLDAEILLLETLNRNNNDAPHPNPLPRGEGARNKSWLYLNNEYKLNKAEEELFNDLIKQRSENKPIAYIVNRKEFYGYDFFVDENVLIPRPETELIVEEVLKIANDVNQCSGQACLSTTLIDIGTGSGCIIISILNKLSFTHSVAQPRSFGAGPLNASIFANDISEKAIEIAKINAKKYNLNQKIKFITGDLKKVITKKIFSASDKIIITANLPYIKNSAYKNLSEDIKKYEPKIALTAGEDGLDYIEKLITLISKIQLKSNQKIYLFLEADPDQMSEITTISREKLAGVDVEIIKDLSGRERIVKLLHSLSSQNFF